MYIHKNTINKTTYNSKKWKKTSAQNAGYKARKWNSVLPISGARYISRFSFTRGICTQYKVVLVLN